MSRADHAGSADDRGGSEAADGLAVRRDEVEPGPDGATGRPPRVTAAGELDAGTASRLLEALSAAIDEAARTPDGLLVVALDEVTFCDSRGLSVLVTATRSAARAGASLRLVAAPEAAVSRLLERTGMNGLLPLHPDVGSALAASAPSPLEQEVQPDVG
jgi:anti-sigma B factor antagonist